MGENSRQSNPKPAKPASSELVLGNVTRLVFSMLALLLLLALISYNPADTDMLADGRAIRSGEIQNWIGHLGACLAAGLMQVFGFAAYLLCGILLLSFLRRLLWRRGARPVRWEYWVSFALITLGGAMFLGLWPDLWPLRAAALNIVDMPGGALGQRLSSPDSGWLRMVLNPTGGAIVSLTISLVGLAVLWIYDWHELFLHSLETIWDGDDQPANPLPTEPVHSREQERQRKRAEKEQRQLAKEQAREEKRRRKEEARRADTMQLPPPPRPMPVELPLPVTEADPEAAPTGKPPTRKTPPRRPAYKLPGVDILHLVGNETVVSPGEIAERKQILQDTLDSFGIEATVGNATSGPRVTLFEVDTAPGVKVERVSQIANNIAMELQAVSLRILTPIPGRKSVGIEVPNTESAIVCLRSQMEGPAWKSHKTGIPLVLGRNISGKDLVIDLTKAPHLLIAGATGSGKSVCINAMIMSLLYRFTPEELRLILVDPKVVEFSGYSSLPHLVVPVITESKKVPLALRWAINEMEKRYRMFAKVGARNIAAFNARPHSPTPVLDDHGKEIPDKVPFIVLIIDELADIMMTAKAEVETSLARIAQLSRAVGIHTIIATQRPSVNVITGVIKANYPTRVAFQVTSQVDSRTILDGKGAETLLGRGDMLFKPPGAAKLERIQSPLVEDVEIERVVAFVASQCEQQFDMSVFKSAESGGDTEQGGEGGDALSNDDEELIARATEVIVRDRRATTSYIQRALRIGYNRAAMIIDILEQRGVIGPQVGTLPREILVATASGNGNGGDDDETDLGDDEAPWSDDEHL